MLKYRLITALVLIPLLFWSIITLPFVYFSVLMAFFTALSAWEWSKLIGFKNKVVRFVYMMAVLLGVYFSSWLPSIFFLAIGFFIWIWAALAVWRYGHNRSPLGFQRPEVAVVVGFFVLVACWLSLVTLRIAPSVMGSIWLTSALLIIWATDTGAYFAGKLWGKHPLIPKVSPKKTWEGFFGGLVLGLIVAIVVSFFFPFTVQERFVFFGIAVIASLLSVVGDLTVSLFKRQSGVKDSGQMLPGHGGILDRVDSIAAGVVVFALGLLFFGFLQ